MTEETSVGEAVEEAAGEQLGVTKRDRPAIFREVAEAAVDSGVPYWAVLILSGAIATLGLAVNSSAVVIGAMLVAPLLAPLMALALAMAMGDGRLAVQSGAVVFGSTVVVIAAAALVTALLPFHTITPEITSRVRPTVLDLGIAVFSGIVGALVTIERGPRLSAAIPGVAVAVALIPPLAVAGFGIGAGWRVDLIGGSLLLVGANLAGIVLSGLLVFLLVGMHRPPVVKAAREWHRSAQAAGPAAWVLRVPGIGVADVFGSPFRRALIALGFAAVLLVPLTRSLREITRETRVRNAVADTEVMFESAGRSSILGRQVTFGSGGTRVHLRVATTEWFGEEARLTFEREASGRAGEPVRLVLEQLPSTSGDVEALADLFGVDARADAISPAAPPPGLRDLFAMVRGRAEASVLELPFPAGTRPVQIEVALPHDGGGRVRVIYAGEEPLGDQAGSILEQELRNRTGHPRLALELVHVALPAGAFRPEDAGPAGLQRVAEALRGHPGLGVEVRGAALADSAAVADLVRELVGAGIDPGRITERDVEGEDLRLRLIPVPTRPGG